MDPQEFTLTTYTDEFGDLVANVVVDGMRFPFGPAPSALDATAMGKEDFLAMFRHYEEETK